MFSFWWIPIAYLTPDHLDVNAIKTTTWMKGKNEARISELPSKDDFIIINPDYAGMCNALSLSNSKVT